MVYIELIARLSRVKSNKAEKRQQVKKKNEEKKNIRLNFSVHRRNNTFRSSNIWMANRRERKKNAHTPTTTTTTATTTAMTTKEL